MSSIRRPASRSTPAAAPVCSPQAHPAVAGGGRWWRAHQGDRQDRRGSVQDFPLEALGSGSDYSSFLQHLGLASLTSAMGGEGSGGRCYILRRTNTLGDHSKFVDPGFAYAGGALAKDRRATGPAHLGVDLPVQRVRRLANTVATLSRRGQEARRPQAERRKPRRRRCSPTNRIQLFRRSHAQPRTAPRGRSCPTSTSAPTRECAHALKASARRMQRARRQGRGAPRSKKSKLVELRGGRASATDGAGLPEVAAGTEHDLAPGRLTGYGAKTLPGVREAIEDERWADVDTYVVMVGKALTRTPIVSTKASALLTARPRGGQGFELTAASVQPRHGHTIAFRPLAASRAILFSGSRHAHHHDSLPCSRREKLSASAGSNSGPMLSLGPGQSAGPRT